MCKQILDNWRTAFRKNGFLVSPSGRFHIGRAYVYYLDVRRDIRCFNNQRYYETLPMQALKTLRNLRYNFANINLSDIKMQLSP